MEDKNKKIVNTHRNKADKTSPDRDNDMTSPDEDNDNTSPDKDGDKTDVESTNRKEISNKDMGKNKGDKSESEQRHLQNKGNVDPDQTDTRQLL